MKKVTKLNPETIKKIWSVYHFVDAIVGMALSTFIGDDPTMFVNEISIRDSAVDCVKNFLASHFNEKD